MATFRPSPSALARPHDITPGYFRTWGIPLLAGRDFNEHDMADHPNVILISQAGAKKVFGNENPIGKTLLVTSGSVPVEIVGVVGDVRSARLAEAPTNGILSAVGAGEFSVPHHNGAQHV